MKIHFTIIQKFLIGLLSVFCVLSCSKGDDEFDISQCYGTWVVDRTYPEANLKGYEITIYPDGTYTDGMTSGRWTASGNTFVAKEYGLEVMRAKVHVQDNTMSWEATLYESGKEISCTIYLSRKTTVNSSGKLDISKCYGKWKQTSSSPRNFTMLTINANGTWSSATVGSGTWTYDASSQILVLMDGTTTILYASVSCNGGTMSWEGQVFTQSGWQTCTYTFETSA